MSKSSFRFKCVFVQIYVETTCPVVYLGLGTKTTWLALGEYNVLDYNTWNCRHQQQHSRKMSQRLVVNISVVSQLHMMKAALEYRPLAYSNLYLNREIICIQQISK